MPDDPKPASRPDDQTLAATEARLKKLLATPSGGGFESTGGVHPAEPTKSARESARERLRANPPDAVARRLRRTGIAATPQKSGFESLPNEAVFPESGQLSHADIALGLERIIGRNELLGVQYLDGGRAASRPVGRILIRRGTRVVGMGTGFLVSPRLLLTNNHVLPTPQSAQGSLVQFNYQYGLDGRPLTAVSFDLDPDAFYLTSASTEFDFTLVAVRDSADGGAKLADFGFRRLAALADEVLAGECVTIIQHPGGEPKQIALRENFVLALPAVADRYLYYQTDTTPGSSGSPVFNDDWEVVALHHSGYAKRDGQNQILARDGRVWTEDMGEDAIDWIANEGVRVAALVKYLGGVTGLDEAKKQILNMALAPASPAAPRVAGPQEAVTPTPPPVPANPPAPAAAPVVAASIAETVVTIPLQISVRLGAPQSAAAAGLGGLEKIEIDTDYSDREGYSPTFLGGGKLRVPMPTMTPAMVRDAAVSLEPADSIPKYELPYHHYSLVMNTKRRLAFFTAVNIDGMQEKNFGKREQDRWIRDHRLGDELQIGNEWYAKPFDRGHLVRRLDPAWGRTAAVAKTANDDTFHFTNCSPQHSKFNQGKNLWQGLENYLLDTANKEDRRISVFTGPIFAADDPDYKGVQVPKRFWKVAAFVRADGTMGACGFIVSQEELLSAMGLESAAEQVARTFQVRIGEIERLTKLDFGGLRALDTFKSGGSPLEAAPAELEEFEQIEL
ncbi:MAG: DNA/RNA non-specific endonuclease [Gemmataceae bacterium]